MLIRAGHKQVLKLLYHMEVQRTFAADRVEVHKAVAFPELDGNDALATAALQLELVCRHPLAEALGSVKLPHEPL